MTPAGSCCYSCQYSSVVAVLTANREKALLNYAVPAAKKVKLGEGHFILHI